MFYCEPGVQYAIYLLAQHQGKGIGQQLAITLVNRLRQEGLTALRLWVLAENPARRFYERLGGRPIAEKTVMIGGVPLIEVAYGWRDSRMIIEMTYLVLDTITAMRQIYAHHAWGQTQAQHEE